MLTFALSLILPHNRAVTAEIWLREYSVLCIASLVATIGAGAMFFGLEPKIHRHESYHTVQVTSIIPTGGDTGRMIIDVILPDGSARHMTTKSGAILGGITKTACIERRKRVGTGKLLYRLVPSHNCLGV